MKSREALETFGEKLISQVRDESLDHYHALCKGALKAAENQEISQQLAALTEEQRELFRKVVTTMVDYTIHNQLSMIESEEDIKLVILFEGGTINLSEASDGLAGELYSEEGWIAKYSKHESYLD